MLTARLCLARQVESSVAATVVTLAGTVECAAVVSAAVAAIATGAVLAAAFLSVFQVALVLSSSSPRGRPVLPDRRRSSLTRPLPPTEQRQSGAHSCACRPGGGHWIARACPLHGPSLHGPSLHGPSLHGPRCTRVPVWLGGPVARTRCRSSCGLVWILRAGGILGSVHGYEAHNVY